MLLLCAHAARALVFSVWPGNQRNQAHIQCPFVCVTPSPRREDRDVTWLPCLGSQLQRRLQTSYERGCGCGGRHVGYWGVWLDRQRNAHAAARPEREWPPSLGWLGGMEMEQKTRCVAAGRPTRLCQVCSRRLVVICISVARARTHAAPCARVVSEPCRAARPAHCSIRQTDKNVCALLLSFQTCAARLVCTTITLSQRTVGA